MHKACEHVLSCEINARICAYMLGNSKICIKIQLFPLFVFLYRFLDEKVDHLMVF
jgi:hypothetical protein